MADEPTKEFTINVAFSGVEQAILGEFKRQIDGVSDAIKLVASTMDLQIEALKSIQEDIKSISVSGGGGGLFTPAPTTHAATPTGQPRGDASEMTQAVTALTQELKRASSGGTMFGRRGLTSGYREWDEENSFEQPQYPGGHFTMQDAIRQAGTMFGGYRHGRGWGAGGGSASETDIEAAHAALQANPTFASGTRKWQAEDYINAATQSQPWYTKPWAKAFGHIEGTEEYMNSLEHTDEEGNTTYGFTSSPWSRRLAKTTAVLPYFSKGGAFNPGTYGLGMQGLRSKAGMIGNMGRYGMQFGDDQSYNPFGDSGSQLFGGAWQGAKNSWFGLNPYLSSAQAQEIQGTVAGMGYSRGTAEQMRQTMSDVTQHTNIPIATQGQMIDQSFRWGYASLQQLASFMKTDIPAAAQAARLNVSQFSQQLLSVASQLGQTGGSGGVNTFKAMQQISTMSTGMGISPGTAGAVLGDTTTSWLAASIMSSQTGKGLSLGALNQSGDRGKYEGMAMAQQIRNYYGYTPDEIQDMLGDPSKKAQIQAINDMLAQAPGLLPGITTIQDMLRYTTKGITRTDVTGKANQFISAATQYADNALAGSGLSGDMRNKMHDKLINAYGSQNPGNKAALVEHVKQLAHDNGWSQADLFKVLGHHTDVTGAAGRTAIMHEVAGDSSRSLSDITKALVKQMGKDAKTENDRASRAGQKVQFTLTAGPELRGLLDATVGKGNSAYIQGGSGGPAPASNPSSPLVSGTVGG